MEKYLAKELEQRGTAEITNGVVNQVTQAISETPTEVQFLVFGELRRQGIIPIDEACAKCGHRYFATVKECQSHQKKDAVARGFNGLICSQQFVD